MAKAYFILNAEKRGSGVVSVVPSGGKQRVRFEIKNFVPLGKNEVFKGYIISGSAFEPIGSMNSGKDTFTVDRTIKVDGAALMRKNLQTEKTELEFWAGKEGSRELAEAFLAPEAASAAPAAPPEKEVKKTPEEEPVAEPVEPEASEAPEEAKLEAKRDTPGPEENGQEELENQMEEVETPAMPEIFTFENFFGGDFEWQRVNGYYCVHPYKIIRHIMAGNPVYERVNQAGFYYTGTKEHEGVLYIATAVPVRSGRGSPFSPFQDYVYTLQDNGRSYDAICVGIDSKGEFFVQL